MLQEGLLNISKHNMGVLFSCGTWGAPLFTCLGDYKVLKPKGHTLSCNFVLELGHMIRETLFSLKYHVVNNM